jgi:hypothetical protein
MPDIDPNLPEGTGPAEPTGTGRFFSEEEFNAAIEKARQQEKDKLYPTISRNDERSKAMADELKELRAFQKKQEKTEADRLAAIEAERKKAAEAELSAKELIDKRQAEFEARMAQIEADNSQRVALVEKELEFTRLQAYIQRRINEEQDAIAPELLDFIDGNTPEAVEASIERVKAKTALILENVRGAGVRQRAAMPGVAPSAGTNAVGPIDAPGNRELTAADINAMGMGEYAELRKRAGIGGANNQGLFRA